MSHVVCIAGESGTGKTTSMRNLDPQTTLYIDCDKKGLSWKGWKKDFNKQNKNYLVTDFPQVALQALRKVNEQENMKHIKVIVVDTINGLMVADEMRRAKEKGYDKWQDLAQSIYDLIDYSLTMRDDVTIVFWRIRRPTMTRMGTCLPASKHPAGSWTRSRWRANFPLYF